jgi:ubiquinone biosynthesis protein
MLLETLSAMRDLGRLHDIASILIRYGFGDLVRRLGLEAPLVKAGRALNWTRLEHLLKLAPPERVRKAMEEMGPTFIKLGQVLATRVDLFGPEWISEFEKLQDRVPPLSFSELRAQLEDDLETTVAEAFAEFDESALAAASIAQVHKAKLRDGRVVIVKIRRPGIRPTVEADLRLLERLVAIVETEFPEARRFRPRDIFRQFELSLRNELDLLTETRNMDRIGRCFQGDPHIVIPKPVWQFCGERVNVQEFIDGLAGREISSLSGTGIDRKLVAQRGVDAVLRMALFEGFFHADPHPGNFIYLPGNRIAFIDFGMVGSLTEARRAEIVDLLNALITRDAATIVEVLLDWAGDMDTEPDQLKTEMALFVERYHGLPIKDVHLVEVLGDMTTMIRDHGLTLPPDLTMLLKTLITMEGMGRQIDPDFDIVTQVAPLLRRATAERYKPETVMRNAWRNVGGLMRVFGKLPEDLRRMMRLFRRGAVKINVEMNELARFGTLMDRAASRLTVGMVTASLIIGSSIVMTVTGGPTLFGLPALGVLGFTAAGLGGFWVLASIWSTTRGKDR